MDDSLKNHIRSAFGSIINVIPNEPHPYYPGSKIMRLRAPTEKQADELLERMTFCHLRWELVSRAWFRFKRHPSVEDKEPLRFFIPFCFCEPRKWWYKYAPFRINLHSSEAPVAGVEIISEKKYVRMIDNDCAEWRDETYWTAQVIIGTRFSDFVRPTYSISFAWSK